MKKGEHANRTALILSFILFFILFAINTAVAQQHFHLPFSTQGLTHYSLFLGRIKILGKDAGLGDEVAFFDSGGTLCGVYVINVSGQYGPVHVFGDDPSTFAVDEGAVKGEKLGVKVWDSNLNWEYSGDYIYLSEGTAQGYVPSPIPPIWNSDVDGYILNVDVLIISDDDNKDHDNDDEGGCFLGSASDNFGFKLRIR